MADEISPKEDKAKVAQKVLSLSEPAEIKEALIGHDDLREELMTDYEAFAKKYTKTDEGDTESDESVNTDDVTKDDDELIEIKLPKKFLGTYKDGETLYRSMLHKDEVIETLKANLQSTVENGQRETTSLRKMLEEHKQNVEPSTKKDDAIPEIDVDSIIGESIDMLDENASKKVYDAFKIIASNNKKLADKIASLEGNVNKVTSVVESDIEAKNRKIAESAEQEEFERIKKKSGVFISDRPIGEIESEYVAFLSNGSRLLGFDGTVYDAKGQFTEGAVKAFRLYFDEKEGAEFKDKLKAAEIPFPEDYADMQKKRDIEDIRNTRQVFDKVSGTYKPMPWEEAVALYKFNNGIGANIELESRKKGAEAYAKAVNKRGRFATEIRPSEGAPSQASLDTDTVRAMITAYAQARKTGNQTESQHREALHGLLISGGMTAAEVEVYLDGFPTKT